MVELPQYVAMSPESFQFQRGIGNVSIGSIVDHHRQPGVVGMYGRKPVFLYVNDVEKQLLESGDIEGYFVSRGFKNHVLTNKPPEGPKTTIP